MQFTLSAIGGFGIVCIACAIVGGGMKAFGMELPKLESKSRQILLAGFGFVLILTCAVFKFGHYLSWPISDVQKKPNSESLSNPPNSKIDQSAKDGQCQNIVAGSSVNLDCTGKDTTNATPQTKH